MRQDEANNRHLLLLLADVPPERRTARYVCAAALADPSGGAEVHVGTCDGVVLDAPRGTGGFGYDPLFFYPPLGQSFAELSAEEKNRVSHRAQACRAARAWLLSQF